MKITLSDALLSYCLMLFCSVLLLNCSSDKKSNTSEAATTEVKEEAPQAPASDDPLSNKGIGPITEVVLGDIDNDMAAEGKKQFEMLCVACHKTDEKFIGPAMAGLTERRSPEWIMNMIMNPEEMVEKDPIGQQILKEANGVPMINQNISEENARNLLEYFRTL